MYHGQVPLTSVAINPETEDAALLNLLHQELKDINESMVRANTALLELVEEMKSLRASQQRDSTSINQQTAATQTYVQNFLR